MTIQTDAVEPQTTVAKDVLGLAGEYAVASELCRRGKYAQLTLGNKKQTDLLVESGNHFLKVEVKSKQTSEWPGVKGIHGNSVLVFVDFRGKGEGDRPDFYILTVADWRRLVKKRYGGTRGFVMDKENVPRWEGIKFTGMGVKPDRIAQFKDRWEKFDNLLSS